MSKTELINLINDERTKKYIKSCFDNINFLHRNCGSKSIEKAFKDNNLNYKKLKEIKLFDSINDSGVIDLYEYWIDNEVRYAAEYWLSLGDDYRILSYIFSKIPSKYEINLAIQLDDLISDFSNGKIDYEYKCWDCGTFVHWLHGQDKLQKKIERVKNRYCGC